MRLLLILACAAAIVGCGDNPSPVAHEKQTPAAPDTIESPKQSLPLPDFARSSKLGLVRRSGTVTVGMSVDVAFGIFADPQGSYENNDRPPTVPEPYETRGWQTKGEGFGLILYKSKVVSAVHQVERVNSDRVDELLNSYREEYGLAKSFVPGRYVRYWFWDNQTSFNVADRVLMICSTELSPGRFNVTEAIGWLPVMQALGMTYDAAVRDAGRANELIDRKRSGKGPNSSNPPNRRP